MHQIIPPEEDQSQQGLLVSSEVILLLFLTYSLADFLLDFTPKISAAPLKKGAVIADPAVRCSPQYNLEVGKQPYDIYH